MFSSSTVNRTSSNELTSQQWRHKLDSRINFLTKKLVEHWRGLMGHWWNPHLQWMVQRELALRSSAVRYAMLVKGNTAGDEVQRSYCRPFVAGCLTQGASYLPSADGQYVASFQASCSSTAQTQHSFLRETAMPTPYPLKELKRRWELLLSQGKVQVTSAILLQCVRNSS